MVETKNFPRAYVEVDEILKKLPQEEFERIESNFINMIRNKKDKNYTFKLDYSKDIEEQNILKETRAILAYVFLNYLGTEEENRIIKQKFKEDIIRAEEEKKKIYSNEIFKDKKEITNNISQELIVYKEENIIKKFIKRILNLFKKG